MPDQHHKIRLLSPSSLFLSTRLVFQSSQGSPELKTEAPKPATPSPDQSKTPEQTKTPEVDQKAEALRKARESSTNLITTANVGLRLNNQEISPET